MLLQIAGFFLARGSILHFVCVHLCACEHTHTYHIFLIHSCIVRLLGCFHILLIVDNAGVNMGCRYLFKTVSPVLSNIYTEVDLLNQVLVVFLNFWGGTVFIIILF